MVLGTTVLLLVVAVDATSTKEEMELTPFGWYPVSCVRRLGRGQRLVHRLADKIDVMDEFGEVLSSSESKAHCLAHSAKMAASRHQTSENGWLDYVEFYPPRSAAYFAGVYEVPKNPPLSEDQVLFYFIGMENMKDTSGMGVTILQPVLTWGNGQEGWTFAAWNCCPVGEATTSNYITGLKAGDLIYGNVTVDYAAETATVGARLLNASSSNGGDSSEAALSFDKEVSLTVQGELRTFDWLDITHEVYSVASCDEFAKTDVIISDLDARDERGDSFVPDWNDATGNTDCDGKQTITDNSWTLHHDITAHVDFNGVRTRRR